MISADAIDSLAEEWQREAAISALATLNHCGAIQAQIAIEQERILSGSDDEPAEELAARVLRYRAAKAALESLADLGKTYRVTKESDQ